MSGYLFLPLLVLHIVSGLAALAGGLAAMSARKAGLGLHAAAGDVFCHAMTAMALSAALLTAWEPDRLSFGAAVWVVYLVHSGRSAARERSVSTGAALRWWMPVGATAALLFLHGGLLAATAPDGQFQGSAAMAYFVFGTGATLACVFDLRRLRGASLTPRGRIVRHLWRMVVAYLLAVTSLFLGQQDDVFPFMAGSPLLSLPSLLTLLFLGYWMLRVRHARHWPGPVPRVAPANGTAPSTEEIA